MERFLKVAAGSFVWYEHMREKLPLAPVAFAYDYVMRGGTVTHERLRPALAGSGRRLGGLRGRCARALARQPQPVRLR